MTERELKRVERTRLAFGVAFVTLAVLLASVGTAKARSEVRLNAKQIRTLELRAGAKTCMAAITALKNAKPSVRQSKLSKACAALVLKGACRSAFVRGEKLLPACLGPYCSALTAIAPTQLFLGREDLCRAPKKKYPKKKNEQLDVMVNLVRSEMSQSLPRRESVRLSSLFRTSRGSRGVQHVINPGRRALPQTSLQKEGVPRVVLSINRAGKGLKVVLEKRSWTFSAQPNLQEMSLVREALRALAAKEPVLIRAGADVKEAVIAMAIDACQEAGFKKVVIARPEK
jgi:biopolymer transport protein ExbD